MEATKQVKMILFVLGALCCLAELAVQAAPSSVNICAKELENSNRSLALWAENMEYMVNESNLPVSVRDSIHSEANQVLDQIEDFGQLIGKPNQAPGQLARELVNIRRRCNRLALDIYLNTFDMRWPQNSVQLGVIVERVQQACLDRAAIQALESPANPLGPLAGERATK